MIKFFKGIGLAAVLTLLILSSLQARTGYVSDMLILTFRDGPGPNHTVITTLKSNTPLTVLEEDQGYYKVRLTSDEEGWVDKQFVSFDPPKSLLVEKLEREKADLEHQLAQAVQTSAQLKSEIEGRDLSAGEKQTGLESRIEQMEKENQRLSLQLEKSREDLSALKAASADIVKTLEANKSLSAENERLSQALSKIESQNSRLFRTGMIKWFLAGVGVLLMGWLFGLMLSGRRKRTSSLLD